MAKRKKAEPDVPENIRILETPEGGKEEVIARAVRTAEGWIMEVAVYDRNGGRPSMDEAHEHAWIVAGLSVIGKSIEGTIENTERRILNHLVKKSLDDLEHIDKLDDIPSGKAN